MDISSAIEAVNAMVNVVLKAVQECGDLDGANAKCGLAVGVLTKSFAGVAAGSAGVTAKCPNKLNGFSHLNFLVRGMGPSFGNANGALANAAGVAAGASQASNFGSCIVNVKDVTKNIFKAAKRLVTVKHNCNGHHKKHCAHNALKIVASFAAIGEYLSGAIGYCSANIAKNAKMQEDAECASEALDLVGSVHRLSSAAVAMKKHCHIGEARLYELEHGEGVQEGSSYLTITLAAFLPITAVLAFVVGKRFGKTQHTLVTVEE